MYILLCIYVCDIIFIRVIVSCNCFLQSLFFIVTFLISMFTFAIELIAIAQGKNRMKVAIYRSIERYAWSVNMDKDKLYYAFCLCFISMQISSFKLKNFT